LGGSWICDRTSIVGVGFTTFTRNSGVSTATLAVDAIDHALADAGLSRGDVDGLATYSLGDSIGPPQLAPMLGLKDLSFWVHQRGGGSVSHSIIGQAALACATGQADVVVCYRSLNARSEARMAGAGLSTARTLEVQYREPYGLVSPTQEYALAARQHMHRYGTTHEHLGAVAVAQREYASLNERAMMRAPLTLDQYMASRWIADPLRLLDCCLESDGACAVVVTSTERAKDLRQLPVKISGAAWGLGHTSISNGWPDQSESAAIYTAPRVFAMAGLTPKDVDVAELYDCYTYVVLVQLEDLGFCRKGEAGDFVADGQTRLGGSLPVNTHGGNLSEAYIHGMTHVCEAVLQLRGACGDRQVVGAEVAISAAQPGIISGETCAVILTK
jgi:acetyl-CoA acetyltransferase